MQFGEQRPMPPSLPSYDYGQPNMRRAYASLIGQTLLVISLGIVVVVLL